MPVSADNTAPCPKPGDTCLANYLEMLPGLAWRIDIVGNDITFLNDYTIASIREKARTVLQNHQLARQFVLPEDSERFLHCFRQIMARKPTACMFRLRLDNGSMGWFKLVSMPDPEHATCSIGLLLDITGNVSAILSSEGRPSLSARLDIQKDPVLLVRMADRSLHMANQAARRLLQYGETEAADLDLQRLFQGNPPSLLMQIYEELIFSDHWTGELLVTDSQGCNHQCSARIQAIARDDENLLWVTLKHLNQCKACKGSPVRGNETLPPRPLAKALHKCSTVKEILETLLKALPEDSPTDAIMLSRIFIDKNEVAVTGVGLPFETVPENRTHPYEGSIAENIVRFGLDNHVVMETSKSIKPIDWALFIPRGIQSYYAQPFFEQGVLTNVLIFCSRQSGNYDPDADAPLADLYPELIKHILRCQKKERP